MFRFILHYNFCLESWPNSTKMHLRLTRPTMSQSTSVRRTLTSKLLLVSKRRVKMWKSHVVAIKLTIASSRRSIAACEKSRGSPTRKNLVVVTYGYVTCEAIRCKKECIADIICGFVNVKLEISCVGKF